MIVPGKGERDLARYAQAHLDAANGGTNAIGKEAIRLAPGEAQTVINDNLCTPGALPQWRPTSATAAVATVWLVSTDRGTFTLGHDVSAAIDRTFRYEIRRP